MRVLGVDPGLSGAFVILDGTDIAEHYVMPTKPYGKKRQVDCAAVTDWIENKQIDVAFLEQVNGFKGGSASLFNFGRAFGMAEAVIEAVRIPVHLVLPQVWKRHHGLLKTDKDAARQYIQQIYPETTIFNSIGKGQAYADATLIALYGRHCVTQTG